MNATAAVSSDLDVGAQARMVEALRHALEAESGTPVRLIETHISLVLLTGSGAIKVKKAVGMGFLDFRTLPSRRYYCEEELRLNRRFAPDLYLDVVPITGSVEAPVLAGGGPAIEYAVRMREFDQESLATRMLERNAMTPSFVDALAARVAAVHTAARSDPAGGDRRVILRYALRNFERTRGVLNDPASLAEIEALRQWTQAEYDAITPILDERRARGRIRECHGDLHLNNIAGIDGRPVIFDCIEFSDDLRFIDVMSDVAFLVMDFRDRGRPDYANRFLNAYLEAAGDYEGLRVLRFYIAYRAMVRAMVACERARQHGAGPGADADRAQAARYVALAAECTRSHDAAIVVTHGFSGCGKTSSTQGLVERTGAVRIRTDVERKRLHNLRPTDRDPAGLASSMYSDDVTRWVYLRVLALARCAVTAGYAAIVDGTFLKRWQRRLFRNLAIDLHVPFVIVSFAVRPDTLRSRIRARMARGTDASDADLDVLEAQLLAHEVLDAEECLETVLLDNEISLTTAQSPERWAAVVERIASQRGEHPACRTATALTG